MSVHRLDATEERPRRFTTVFAALVDPPLSPEAVVRDACTGELLFEAGDVGWLPTTLGLVELERERRGPKAFARALAEGGAT